eukprot:m.306339 g.306339  ORF g.306339 m.306339 type:complete len:72 (+) comp41163_c0_seq1:2566-2781(+)
MLLRTSLEETFLLTKQNTALLGCRLTRVKERQQVLWITSSSQMHFMGRVICEENSRQWKWGPISFVVDCCV